ncbi:MAG: flavodoxin family protein [Acidobacteria bacterium]|nr:flavodoxin family protein [Acidobacteriota bacterium]
MSALVIWESLTGTTRKAADLVAAGLRAAGIETTVSPAARVDLAALSAARLVIVGTWTDGIFVVGQKPGRAARLWSLPFMTGKPAFVFCTYAVDPGHAVQKLAAIVEDRGAEVIGGQAVSRFHVERDCTALVEQVLDAVLPVS